MQQIDDPPLSDERVNSIQLKYGHKKNPHEAGLMREIGGFYRMGFSVPLGGMIRRCDLGKGMLRGCLVLGWIVIKKYNSERPALLVVALKAEFGLQVITPTPFREKGTSNRPAGLIRLGLSLCPPCPSSIASEMRLSLVAPHDGGYRHTFSSGHWCS